MLPVRVTVMDRNAVFKDAITTIVEREIGTWAQTQQHLPTLKPLELRTLRSEDDWADLRQRERDDKSVLVALVPELDHTSMQRSIGLGVDGVADADAPSEIILAAVRCAVLGEFLLPACFVRSVVGDLPPHDASLSTDDEIILKDLAQGRTVTRMAEERFVSERVMYRRLQRLYMSLGVSNRAQAISTASRMGI